MLHWNTSVYLAQLPGSQWLLLVFANYNRQGNKKHVKKECSSFHKHAVITHAAIHVFRGSYHNACPVLAINEFHTKVTGFKQYVPLSVAFEKAPWIMNY